MSRSPRAWGPRLRASRRSVPALSLPETDQRLSLTARLDPHGSLADGVLIQGSVRGRVFGVPILKINTTLVLTPAQINSPATRAGSRRTPQLPRSSDFRRSSGADAVDRRRLADAVKTIGEGAEQLATSRRTDDL
jgi:hypothetical protein